MRLGFKVVGVPEAAGALNQLSDEMAGKKLVNAALAGAKILTSRWKDFVHAWAYRTGNYMRSIHEEVTHQSRTRVEVTVGTDIIKPPYPFFLEYGTSKMAPRPCARAAWDASKDDVATEIEESLLESVGLIWR